MTDAERKRINEKFTEDFGNIFFNCLKPIGLYLKYSFLFAKKTYLNKFRDKGSKISTSILLGLFGLWAYIKPGNLNLLNKWDLLMTLSPLIYLPFAHLLIKTVKREDFNKIFLNHYEHMGFKNDNEKKLQFPYCVGKQIIKKDIIYTFKANRNKLDVFKKSSDILEEVTNLEFREVRKHEKNKSLVEVVFLNKDYKVDRLNIAKVSIDEENDDFIPISQELKWEFRKQPHMLINGGTGGGKSFFIFYLVKALLELKAKVIILDPKYSDLSYLDDYLGEDNVVYKHEDIARLLLKTVDDMFRRAKEIKKRPDRALGKDYKDYGYKPVFIIFDEVMSFMRGGIDRETKSAAEKALLDIIAMGRQLGFFAVEAMQRGSTKSIDGDVRAQFHFRCTLGKMDADGYKMAFGDNYHLRKTLDGKGSGFVQVEGIIEEPEEFYTPYISKNFDILQDIARIIGEVQVKKVSLEKKEAENEKEPIKLSDLKKIKDIKVKN